MSSYPTYEEWKPTYFCGNINADFFVLILPMRNGNIYSGINMIANYQFLSYLWGMETHKDCTNWAGIWFWVLILPMRNGNHLLSPTLLLLNFVLILPMRNGNSRAINPRVLISLGSYPTYEEWKQYSLFKKCTILSKFLSYLWGMETLLMPCKLLLPQYVLILPMRNGNFSLFLELFKPFIVLILPMRNGNSAVTFILPSAVNSSYPTYEEWKLETNI